MITNLMSYSYQDIDILDIKIGCRYTITGSWYETFDRLYTEHCKFSIQTYSGMQIFGHPWSKFLLL